MNIFEEFTKCKDSFKYFSETYLKIKHPTRGVVPFLLHGYQERLVEFYENNRFVSVIKFRQGGFSTLSVLYGLWKCVFSNDQRVLFVSKTDREAIALSRVVHDAVRWLPEQFQVVLSRDNDHEKEFHLTGSHMCFYSSAAMLAGGMTHLFIDEAAFIPNMDEVWQSMYPVISAGGKAFVVSTPNGDRNWFAKICYDSWEFKNEFKVFECSYKEHPDYDNPEWVEQVKKNLGEIGFAQEVECKFLPNLSGKINVSANLTPEQLRSLANRCFAWSEEEDWFEYLGHHFRDQLRKSGVSEEFVIGYEDQLSTEVE